MSTTSSGKEQPERLMTIPEIAAHKGLTRQLIHRLATTDPDWPEPAVQAARTRVYREADIDAYFAARKVKPGRRTDRETAKAIVKLIGAGASHDQVAADLGIDAEKVRKIEAAERARKKRVSGE